MKKPGSSGLFDTPKGSRTPVRRLRTGCPGPLDDGGVKAFHPGRAIIRGFDGVSRKALTRVLRYAEEPDSSRKRSGSSEYLRYRRLSLEITSNLLPAYREKGPEMGNFYFAPALN